MEVPIIRDGEHWWFVYYTKQEGRWTIVAVHPEGQKGPAPYTARSIIAAVDELGAFQKVNKCLQEVNAALAEMDVSLSTTVSSGAFSPMGSGSAST
jgi:hypothetical protein